MLSIHPMRILGRWQEGYTLDFHTIRSDLVGYDEVGHPIFETVRSEIGELLYQLKYRQDRASVPPIAEAACSFIASWRAPIEAIVPVPPSKPRHMQPVFLLAEEIARRMGLPFLPCVEKVSEIPELKNIYELDRRIELLTGAFSIDNAMVEGRNILLFDDLYRSGATMNAVSSALYDQGNVRNVFSLTITRTRSVR